MDYNNMKRALIDKETVLEKARRLSGDVFSAPRIIKMLEDAPEVKSGGIRCKNCIRNGTAECPFDKRVLQFRDDERFYCCLGKMNGESGLCQENTI